MKKNILLLGNSHADSIKKTFKEVAKDHGYNTYFFVSNTPMIKTDNPPDVVIGEAKRLKADKIVLHYKSGTIDIENLNKLVSLAAINNINVVLIEPVPIYKESVPKVLYNRTQVAQTVEQYRTENKDLFAKIMQLESYNKNFSTYDVVSKLCNTTCELASSEGRPLYFDEDHLTLEGAKKLKPVFEEIF